MAEISNQSKGGAMVAWLPSIETISYVAFIVSVVAGGLAVAAGAVATVTSNMVAKEETRRADIRIREADSRAAQANARAETARLETERLRASLRDRLLTPEQMQALVNALRDETFTVYLAYNSEDAEATGYRDQFDFALKQTGLKVMTFRGLTGAAVGLALSVPPEHREKQTKLEAALNAAELSYEVWTPPETGVHSRMVSLVIGAKPPPL